MTKWTGNSYDICAPGPQDNVIAKGATGVAAAAVSVTLTHDSTNKYYIQGFTVTSTNPAATVSGVVTVTGLPTNVSGGTLSYEFVESATLGGILNINFASPIPAATLSTDIVVNCPAIASGGAVAVSVQGYFSQY